MSSCRDEFLIAVPPEVGFKYNIQAELNPQNIVAIQLLETVPIGDKLSVIDRQDAIAVFKGADVPGGQLNMAFNSTSEKYHLVNEDFRVSEGNTYEVSITIPGEEELTITASTTVPRAVTFDSEIISTTQIPIDEETSHHEVEVLITLSEPFTRPAYYRFAPYRLESIMKTDPFNIAHTGNKQNLIIKDVLNNNNALEQLAQGGGITIDESRLTDAGLHLILRSEEPLFDGPALDPKAGIEILERFHFELVTMNAEIYTYEKWIDGLLNQGSSFSSPIRDAQNIENASGFFGGSSRSLSFPEID